MAGTVCDPGWVARVYHESRASVVRIENVEGLGTGFVFYSPQYVVTAFHVISLGREITVTSADGAQQSASVVLIDPPHDLAVLQLEHPIAGARPLEPSTDPLPVGTPVLVIGHPYALLDRFNQSLHGLLYWSATQGIISARSDEYLQTDAAVNPGNSGGPLLACDGRVLGVVSSKLEAEAIGFAVPTEHLSTLFRQMGHQSPYFGRWASAWEADFWMQLDPTYTRLGFALGFSVTAFDRWTTTLRAGPLWSVTSPATGAVIDAGAFRFMGELGLAYRLLVLERPVPIYLSPGIGVAATIDRNSQTVLAQQAPAPGCMPVGSPQCLTQTVAVRTHQIDHELWPMATAGLLLGGSLQLSYAFQADFSDLSSSTHRLMLSIPF